MKKSMLNQVKVGLLSLSAIALLVGCTNDDNANDSTVDDTTVTEVMDEETEEDTTTKEETTEEETEEDATTKEEMTEEETEEDTTTKEEMTEEETEEDTTKEVMDEASDEDTTKEDMDEESDEDTTKDDMDEESDEDTTTENVDKEMDIVATAQDNEDFSILAEALEEADLVETLQEDGPFTVFAPTDEAFAQLFEDLDITKEELLAQPDLDKVLTYHVVSDKVMADDLEDGMTVETVNGEEISFDLSEDEPLVNDSIISTTDLEASNGVIHVVDAVLVPEGFELQETEEDMAVAPGMDEESDEETTTEEDMAEEMDIVATAQGNEDFSILAAALEEADLVETLQGDGPFTVFAPTDEAFVQLLEDLDITKEELLAQPDLAKVLTYHVVSGKVMAGDLEDGMTAETVNGEEISFDLSEDHPMVNDSNITATDIEASNGVIHVVDTILVPEDFELQDVELDIVATARDNEDFSILAAALEEAELVETLQGDGPFTVFAPTDEAFVQLLEDLDITKKELLAQPDLDKVLTYHVVSDKVMADDLEDGMTAETVNGEEINFDLSEDHPIVNESNITSTDLEASNGVIHVVDTVLIPKDFELQEVEAE
ncbi:fasciclin domain-containing protein [Facklamia sp. 7083-14-GEN3]|uniref:fasciclin domain-containing protein n=1 Tax=Facklamia sp. 7083-14-GEN3 TaxID=2973478 RepID=UPI00215BC104|nr:fasciclin domain-containing protein [Facklamia sp. 7083-14-GEN3]MCR8969392.1 fasciclin domain-containing protein [Facklamia sp. 7083-14-GEN3]